jgi:hypothetical protein
VGLKETNRLTDLLKLDQKSHLFAQNVCGIPSSAIKQMHKDWTKQQHNITGIIFQVIEMQNYYSENLRMK